MPTTKNIFKIFPFLLVIVASIAFFTFTSPQEILDYIGINNAYFLMFIFAFFAGISTFNAAPYYFLLYFLANAGFDPVYLGITSAMGIMAGDSFVYFMGKEGKDVLPKFLVHYVEKINTLGINYPKTFLLFCFSYGCVSPFSNNFITIASGVAEVPYYKLMIPLGLGNIIYNIGFIYVVIYSTTFFTSFFS